MDIIQRASFHARLGPLGLVVALGDRLPTVLTRWELSRAAQLASSARVACMPDLRAPGLVLGRPG